MGAIVPSGRASLGARNSGAGAAPGSGSSGAQADEAALGIEEMRAELRRLHARLRAVEAEKAQQKVCSSLYCKN